ncbi:hypothetical protein [Halorarum halobium]|uniref:hypothetical protein n=1 Tax=Halorarum halobium TaxID=3075121 RepID=UPI0028ACDC01|nr:hypothetical protein [Halobaculum sp. XH14]
MEKLEEGDFQGAKEEFEQVRQQAELKNEGVLERRSGEEYWRGIGEAAEEAVRVIEVLGSSEEALNRLENVVRSADPDSGVSYKPGVGEEERTLDHQSTDEVIQNRIEFLEEEIENSDEELPGLRRELDELRDYQEE